MSQVIRQEALTRLHVEKGIFTEEEFLEIVRVVDWETKRKRILKVDVLHMLLRQKSTVYQWNRFKDILGRDFFTRKLKKLNL